MGPGDKSVDVTVLLPRSFWPRTYLVLLIKGRPHVTLEIALGDVYAEAYDEVKGGIANPDRNDEEDVNVAAEKTPQI
jgi:hypothetical protein